MGPPLGAPRSRSTPGHGYPHPARSLRARSTEETPMLLRRALPALLAVWGAALLGLAVLDWAGYGVALQLLVLAR
jgi:hypothetical protein